jgi:hypothetical protein
LTTVRRSEMLSLSRVVLSGERVDSGAGCVEHLTLGLLGSVAVLRGVGVSVGGGGVAWVLGCVVGNWALRIRVYAGLGGVWIIGWSLAGFEFHYVGLGSKSGVGEVSGIGLGIGGGDSC